MRLRASVTVRHPSTSSVSQSSAPPPPPLAGGADTVSCAVADFDESATETAVIVTVEGVGTVAGGVYWPVVDIVPSVVLPPTAPSTSQVTDVLEAFTMSAEKEAPLLPVTAVAVAGQTAICSAAAAGLQEFDPDAVAGASVDAEFELTTASAESVRP